jgi:hypothetical protein
MSTTTLAPTEDAYAERWRLWQLANAESNRRTAAQARIVFTVIFITLTGLVGLLLSSRLWA